MSTTHPDCLEQGWPLLVLFALQADLREIRN
jgi:hypothetical protein